MRVQYQINTKLMVNPCIPDRKILSLEARIPCPAFLRSPCRRSVTAATTPGSVIKTAKNIQQKLHNVLTYFVHRITNAVAEATHGSPTNEFYGSGTVNMMRKRELRNISSGSVP